MNATMMKAMTIMMMATMMIKKKKKKKREEKKKEQEEKKKKNKRRDFMSEGLPRGSRPSSICITGIYRQCRLA